MSKEIDRVTAQAAKNIIAMQDRYVIDELERLVDLGVIWIESTPVTSTLQGGMLTISERMMLRFNGDNQLAGMRDKLQRVEGSLEIAKNALEGILLSHGMMACEIALETIADREALR